MTAFRSPSARARMLGEIEATRIAQEIAEERRMTRPPYPRQRPIRHALPAGSRQRLTIDGVISKDGRFVPDDAEEIETPYGTRKESFGTTFVDRHEADFERLPDPAPKWEPGDVIVVRHFERGTPYTYVRGARSWPGEQAAGLTDREVDRLWRNGKVKPVLQAGGEPFAKSRLA